MNFVETNTSLALSYAQTHPSAFFVVVSLLFAVVYWLRESQ